MTDILILAAGLVLIIVGADKLTDGASAIARRFEVSDLVVGLTVVALGTSMPELVVSVFSALGGSPDMAIGNVVGSNIFNILMIIGCTALFSPVVIGRGTMRYELPMVGISSLAVFIMANDVWISAASSNAISRGEGLLLLMYFAIFMMYTFAIARDGAQEGEPGRPMSMLKAVVFVVLGLVMLVGGGELFVKGASGTARSLGVSEAVIGLTIVSGGTSLPELAASVAAALKGRPGMAVGNVIGSNLFNVFLVLGMAASITPLHVGGISNVDLGMLVGSSFLFWLAARFRGKGTISRGEGALMIALYIAYVAYLVLSL